ncbi:uncharacterized protein C8R40DRAFT_1195537 [Lentinula edodes]|uniref:uncharacterized protein n=1 Tax=Lentinula edodes TaxID=5353 RepID=UPI001E8D60B7|nr:uncharacterized protein C8R40DRAFT_1195537 [Lentinula edodes]KAH7874256.1 hypothetical protein C8R40DRAFT_1195537 [Lentinula edodes]
MAAPSGITYKAKRSNREVLRERLQNNSALRDHFQSSRDVHHYKKLTRPTIRNHDIVKSHYRDFAAYTQECFEEGRSEKQAQPAEIVIGTPLPPLEYVKDFVCYLASALLGRDASTFIRLETLRGYMYTFLALWPRYANVHPTLEMRYQVRSYLLSEELQASVKLSTKIRTLKHIEPQCLQIIMETLHSSTNIFRSNRTRLQMAFLILFSAASAARPGSVVESACYRGSNEALTWGDIDFYLIPDDEDPAHPSLVVDIQLNLVKGYRNVDHRYQKLLFTLELRKEHRMTCIVLPLLGLAFHDSVFAHFHSIESLLCPEKPPTTRVKIFLRNEVLTLPVLRKEEKGGGGKVSRTDAFHYDGLNRCLKLLSIAAGFPESITPYDFRASQGNKADVDLGETARKTLMLHDPNSKVYFANADQKCQNKYKSKTMTADLSAVSNRRGQDENRITLFRTVIAASSGRDTNAPQHLSLEERAKLLNEPELVKLQNEKDEATNKIQQLLANEQSEEVEKQIIELRQIAAKASNGHRFLYLRESCLRIKQARQEFFDNAAVRQMLNPAEPVSRMSAGGSDDKKYRVESSFLSLVNDLDSGDPVTDCCTLVNILIAQPERILFQKFYPGERPDEENRCPHCSQELFTMSSTKPGEHVHLCTRRILSEKATAQIQANFSSQECKYGKCLEQFDQRSEFISHLMTHIKFARKKSNHCKWQIAPGVSCGAEDIKDWREHFAEIHGINLDQCIFTEYCTICGVWLYDILGDRQVFSNHHLAHYQDLFDSFSSRPPEGASVSLSPIGIIETEKYIEYTPGSGFDGELPEFHGNFSDGIALVPAFCPSCVFDEKLPMYMRMHQFSNVFHFMEHFNNIHRPLFTESENLCPVPSCGHHRFTKQELVIHFIKFHRKHYKVKRLLLPSPDMEVVKYKRRKKSEGFWCIGCSSEVNDINKHLQRPQNSEKARECARIGKYSVIANGERGPVQLWTAPVLP